MSWKEQIADLREMADVMEQEWPIVVELVEAARETLQAITTAQGANAAQLLTSARNRLTLVLQKIDGEH